MREFVRTFFEIMALMVSIFAIIGTAFAPVLLAIATDDARYFFLVFVSVPAVVAGLTALRDKF